jgi:TRAP-type mannitol/chloroaromatic compound transport system substrate-binding protein
MSFTVPRKLAVAATAIATVALASAAGAADYTLRIQTHHSPESLPGKIFLQFVQDVESNSGGRIDIEDFMSSSVVKSVETFDAASTGILDGDMTGAAYQTGKDPAFQFLGDVMGGYEHPEQMRAWLNEGGGREIADELYANYNMHLVGFWGQVPEASPRPSRSPARTTSRTGSSARRPAWRRRSSSGSARARWSWTSARCSPRSTPAWSTAPTWRR